MKSRLTNRKDQEIATIQLQQNRLDTDIERQNPQRMENTDTKSKKGQPTGQKGKPMETGQGD